MLTKRVSVLKENHLNNFKKMKDTHCEVMKSICLDFYNTYNEQSKVQTVADFMAFFAQKFPIDIQENELIVGTGWHWLANATVEGKRDILQETNIGHYIADFEGFIKLGIVGMCKKVEDIKPVNEKIEENKKAFLTVLKAFSFYIKRYADNAFSMAKSADLDDKERLLQIGRDCELISEYPPQTFRQALQLVWFIQIFLETEACSAALSLGRIDKYLLPYYKKDIKEGKITKEQVLELIMCFYIKLSENDESCMITLGGFDKEFTDDELTILFLKAQTHINMRQPSISIRINSATSNAVWNASEELTKIGGAMPAYFNDEVIIKGLKKIGIHSNCANDYGIVGCYEASPQGAYSNTVATAYNLCESFDNFAKNCEEYDTFEEFFESYKKYYEKYYAEDLMAYLKRAVSTIESWTSPFAGCCLKGCLESGYLPEQYGCEYTMLGVNILGIGVLIDSIYTVKKLVYDEKYTTKKELYSQAENNFGDAEFFEKIKLLKGCYGDNEEESNRLAREISEFIGEISLKYKINDKIILSPALFWFTNDIWQRNYPSTINGRKSGELLSYGVMPCATPHSYPITSIIQSSANINCEYFPNGCPLMITLNKNDFKNGEAVIEPIVKTYFACGGFHFAANIANAEILSKAQKNPEQYENLIIKISGYSTQFISCSTEIQDALIERASRGV